MTNTNYTELFYEWYVPDLHYLSTAIELEILIIPIFIVNLFFFTFSFNSTSLKKRQYIKTYINTLAVHYLFLSILAFIICNWYIFAVIFAKGIHTLTCIIIHHLKYILITSIATIPAIFALYRVMLIVFNIKICIAINCILWFILNFSSLFEIIHILFFNSVIVESSVCGKYIFSQNKVIHLIRTAVILLSPVFALILNFVTFDFFKKRNRREPESNVIKRERLILINITLQGILSILCQSPTAILTYLTQAYLINIPSIYYLISNFLLFSHFGISTLITIIFLKDVRQEICESFSGYVDHRVIKSFMKI
uniref:G_PROTEIN_RECEP_F1_2 domain-containing protein n=1 Tax=Strongyloides papillosus TaxID=174720 RepID=A0A0N5BCG0_STREA